MAIPLFIRARQGRRRPAKRWCVKHWIERRLLFGQYHIHYQELERESEGNCIGYIRMSRDMFAELLLRVTPLISKSNRQVYNSIATLNYNYLLQYIQPPYESY